MEYSEYKDNIILEVLTGSHLYGTNTETSDNDYVGIFIPPKEYVLGLREVKEVFAGVSSKDDQRKNTKDAVDRKFYEFRNFVKLAMACNPNLIEILFADLDNIIFESLYGVNLLWENKKFLSKLCIPKFLGYAKAQKHKLFSKRDKLEDLKQGYDLLCKLSDKQVMVQVQELPFYRKDESEHIRIGDLCFEPGVYVKKARQNIKERLDKFTNRESIIEEFGYDTKYAMNLIRLLSEGLTILEKGELEFPLPNANFLKEIRSGKYKIEKIIEFSEDLENQYEEAEKKTILPNTPDFKKIEEFVIETIEDFWNNK